MIAAGGRYHSDGIQFSESTNKRGDDHSCEIQESTNKIQ